MKKVEKIKKEKGLQTADLPVAIQQDIVGLQNLIVKYNEACDTYEKLDEINQTTEAQLDALEDEIAEVEDSIVEKIKGIEIETKKEIEGNLPKTKVETKTEVETKNEVESKTEEPKGKKSEKDNSAAWLIFGGIALIATLGAVNVFKNK
jgi:hypothetical protein